MTVKRSLKEIVEDYKNALGQLVSATSRLDKIERDRTQALFSLLTIEKELEDLLKEKPILPDCNQP